MEWVKGLVDQVMEWVDSLVEIVEGYTGAFPKLLVYGLLLLIASKIFKVKVDVRTGGKNK